MIIHGHKPQKRISPRLWVGLLSLITILSLAFFIQKATPKASTTVLPFAPISLDAEEIRNGCFRQDELCLTDASNRSSERAFSGKFAYKIPEGDGLRFGFSTRLSTPATPQFIRLSVWVHKPKNTRVYLVAKQGDYPDRYLESKYHIKRDRNWEKLQLIFRVDPNGEPVDCYVYTSNAQAVFLDDFNIEILPIDPNLEKPSTLSLYLSKQDLQQLRQDRDQSLQNGIIFTDSLTWVNSTVQFDQQEIKTRLRLKGDWVDHLQSEKWSYRLKAKGQRALVGNTSWSLHAPEARYFLHEWLFHQLLAAKGILATPYRFVDLTINGKSKGIYAMEGHFTSSLLETQNRLDGPILKWDETGYWLVNQSLLHLERGDREVAPHPLWNIHAAPIIPFDKNKWESQPAGKDLLSTAQEKLNRFLHQESSCQEVFKTDKLAYFLALSDLCISYHGLYWHNLRFYYDPAVGKFEPIGFDSFGEAPPSSNSFLGLMAFQEDIPFINPILQILLYDEDFHKRYIAALQEIIQESFFQTFFEQYKEEILTKLHWLQKEYPFYSWEVTDWSERANYLKNLLYPHPKYSLQVYRRGSQLEFQNWHTLPLEVQLSNGQWKRVLPRESMFATTEERNEFNYRIPGLDYIFYTTITGENTKSYSVSATTLQIPSTLPLEINGKQLSLTSTDTFTISTPLVVPADYTLQLKGGLSLNLVKGGLLEIYGPCNWSNVKVYSEDQRGQGVYIEGSSSIEWEKVHIEDQRAPMVHQFQQFGAVTIVDSEVQFKHCTFRRNRGEDGLYLLRCEVSLEECSFAEQPSDGLDLDFCTGYLTSCSFFQNGNDGLDIAGGNLRLDRLILDGNQEKGLSIGEAARIQAENLRIVNSPIGMAVKDQSIVDLQNLYLKKVNMGIGVYQKKSIFGPAVCRINSLHLEMVPYLYRLGLGSTLILDGKTLEGR